MSIGEKATLPNGYTHNPGFADPDQIPSLYALRGVGTCMEPLIGDGSLLAFNKDDPAQSGDTVNIWFHPYRVKPGAPQGMIKRLLYGLPPKDVPSALLDMAVVVVDQLNPPRQYQIPASHILAIHKCIGFAETDGGRIAKFPTSQHPPRYPFSNSGCAA
jgi:hypothetical protein